MSDRRSDDILSPATLARLHASAGGPGVRRVFTTTAGPRELGELARLGLRPVGAVQGSSIHHVGSFAAPPGPSAEVPGLTRSIYTARRYALARLVAAAQVLGAAGVAGVSMSTTPRAFGNELLEVVASGTAVGPETGSSGAAGTPSGAVAPWTTLLGADELAAAREVGLAPVSVVFGTCVHHLDARPFPEIEHPGQEIPGWTQAVADAREVAVARLQADAQRDGADGVVGLLTCELDHAWSGTAREYLAVASAVRRPD